MGFVEDDRCEESGGAGSQNSLPMAKPTTMLMVKKSMIVKRDLTAAPFFAVFHSPCELM